jgi:hypothetical protein
MDLARVRICAHTEITSHDTKRALCLQIQTQIYQSACRWLVPSHGGMVTSLIKYLTVELRSIGSEEYS